MTGFTEADHLPPVAGRNNPCLNCPPIEQTLAMERVVAVGFGAAMVIKGSEVVFAEGPNTEFEDCWTVERAEAAAAASPAHVRARQRVGDVASRRWLGATAPDEGRGLGPWSPAAHRSLRGRGEGSVARGMNGLSATEPVVPSPWIENPAFTALVARRAFALCLTAEPHVIGRPPCPVHTSEARRQLMGQFLGQDEVA